MNASSAVSLECPALGNPAPAVSWFQNGLPVSPSPRLQVLEEGQVLKVRADPCQGKSTRNQGTVSSGPYKGSLEYGMSPSQHMASVRCPADNTVFKSISHSWLMRSTCAHLGPAQSQGGSPLQAPDHQDLDHHTIASQTPPEINTAPHVAFLSTWLQKTNQYQSCFPRHYTAPQMGLRVTAAGHCEHLQPTCLPWGDRVGWSALWQCEDSLWSPWILSELSALASQLVSVPSGFHCGGGRCCQLHVRCREPGRLCRETLYPQGPR